MAGLSVNGLDYLIDAFKNAGDVPEDVTREMLVAMGAQAESCITESAGTHGVPSGPMLASIYSKSPTVTSDGGKVVTTFKGGRTRYNTYTREAEIAFITNYGKKGEPARPFITDVTQKEDPRISQAGEAVLNAWLEKAGL